MNRAQRILVICLAATLVVDADASGRVKRAVAAQG
jgi:hypothetical protein